MNTPIRYELLKDLPDGAKCLDVYERLNDARYYYNIRLWPNQVSRLETEYVENNPTWFKEIKDTLYSCGYYKYDVSSR